MRALPTFGILTFCLALAAALSVFMGQDVSWDLRNYHLYNPISLFDGRLDLDFFPADKQTGNNPLPDLLYAYLALGPLAHFPRLLAAFMGFWYGLLVFVSFKLASRLITPLSKAQERIFVPLMTLIAVSGAMAVSQIGSTSNDILVALLILSGLLLILPREKQNEQKAFKGLLFGGFLFGLSAGLKLTGGIYAPAMVLALFATQKFRVALKRAALFSALWLLGFGAAFGWWGWMLWTRFANPVFPLFNAHFKSPLAPLLDLRDTRFLPHSFEQWLFYPFTWAFDPSNHFVFESNFSDPRMALAFSALALLAGAALTHTKTDKRQDVLTSPQKITAFFLTFSYFSWLFSSSILRYGIVIEVLSGLMIFVIALRLIENFRLKSFWLGSITGLICLLCLLFTHYPLWERRQFEDKMYDVDMSWVAPNTLFIGVYEPFAYLAAFVPQDLSPRFVGLPFIIYLKDTNLGAKGIEMVEGHQGPIMVILRNERRSFLNSLPLVGLSPEVKNCRALHANVSAPEDPAVYACEATHLTRERVP